MDLHKQNLANNIGQTGKSLAQIVPELLGGLSDHLQASFSNDFSDNPYRLRRIHTSNCVGFVNDSFATTVNATWFALEETPGPIVWIAGGVNKGNDYHPLLELVRKKVFAIVVLGDGYDTFIRDFGEIVEGRVHPSLTMQDAVVISHGLAMDISDILGHPTVLLSPACSSFDLFENYQDRGRQFDEAVQQFYLS